MKLLESFRLALQGLWSNKMRSALTTLGVIIGVLAVILLVSVAQGIKIEVTSQIENLGPSLLTVIPGNMDIGGGAPSGGNKQLKYEDAVAIETQARTVAGVCPWMETSGRIERGREGGRILIGGTSPNYPDLRGFDVSEGRFFGEAQVQSARRVVAIGSRVRADLFGPGENPIGGWVTLSGRRFKVVAVMKEQGNFMGMDTDKIALIPITTARAALGGEGLQAILVKSKSADTVGRTEEEIKHILGRRLGPDDFTIMTQGEFLTTLQSIMGILTVTLGGIAGISLVVGGIGIMNIMLVSVTERTREIGIRKAVGARTYDILTQFLIESMVLSVFGGAIGIGIGFALSAAINAQNVVDLPSAITSWSVMLAFGFSVAVGMFFGVYPAWKASRLDPIEALRYE